MPWKISKNEKEALALTKAIKQNHHFLQNQEFTVYTDSPTLTFLKNLKADAGCLERWSVLLQGYKFILEHKKS